MRTKLEWEKSKQKCKFCFRRKVRYAYDTWVSWDDTTEVKVYSCAACGSTWWVGGMSLAHQKSVLA